MQGVTYIYALFDDTTHSLFYVGHTCSPDARFTTHQYTTAKDCKATCYMEILEQGPNLTAEDELFWITYMDYLGCQLRNKNRIGGTKKPAKRNVVLPVGVKESVKAQGFTLQDLAEAAFLLNSDVKNIEKGKPISYKNARQVEVAVRYGLKRLLKMDGHKRMSIVMEWKKRGL